MLSLVGELSMEYVHAYTHKAYRGRKALHFGVKVAECMHCLT